MSGRKRKMPPVPTRHWTEAELERVTLPERLCSPDSIAGRANLRNNTARIENAKARLDAAELHLHPWKWGVWVSIVDGTLYDGSGGNEREEYLWEQRGPWVLVKEDDALEYKETYKGDRDEAKQELEKLRAGMKKVIGVDDEW